MLNIDRVKRVLKAHKGFQAPQLTEGNRFMLYGPTGMMEDGNRDWFMINNEYLKGSTIPITNSEAEGTSVPNTVVDNPYLIPQFNWSPQLPQSPGYNLVFQQLLDQTLGKDLTKYKYSSLANSDLLLQDTLTKDKGNIFKSIGKFANNNQNLIQGGLNIIGDKLFGGTRNSKGYDIALAGLSAFESVPGLGLYATLGKFALGAVNKIGAKSIEDYHFNPYVYAKAGNSYSGTVNLGNRVRSLNDVEFGWFNRGEYNEAKDLRAEAVDLDYRLEGVMNANDDIRAKAGDNRMYTARNIRLAGGQDPRYIGIGKQGLKLLDKINIVKSRKFNQVINVDTKLVEEFKEGGVLPSHVDNSSINYPVCKLEWEPEIELFEEWEPVIDIFQKGGKTRTLEELIEYAKKENPRFVQRLSEEPRGIKFIDDEGNEGEGSHYLEWSTDDFGNAIIYPRIQEIEDGSLKFFPSNEAYLRAVKTKNILTMSPEEANTFFSEDPEYKTAYKRGWPNFFNLFKLGGKAKEELETPEIEETTQKNLIPEGALHKNKHHMEHTEGLTLKGIPVIDNEGEQLAEIELDEIIFTLEVTKKLEELYKEGTDEAAIEAGKLLVKEILFNTDDRTGLISKCEKGGKICQIEE